MAIEKPEDNAQESLPEGSDIFISEKPLTREGHPRVSLKFIEVIHTPENVREIVEQIGDADIVAMELVGGSEFERSTLDFIGTLVLKTSPKDKHFANLAAEVANLPDPNQFITELLWQLRGSGKEIRFVDISQEDSREIAILMETRRADKQVELDCFLESQEKALRSLEHYIELQALDLQERDTYVALKIIDETEGLEHETKKIAIIQGMMHTGTSHDLTRLRQYDVERAFVPELPEIELGADRIPKVLFSYSMDAARQKRFFPTRTLSKELLERALLEKFVEETSNNLKIPFEMQTHFRRKLVESFSQEEVREMLDEIFSQTHQVRRKLAPIFEDLHQTIRLASPAIGKDVKNLEQQIKYLECVEVRMRALESIAGIMGSHAGITPPKTPFEWVEFMTKISNRNKKSN